MGKRSLKPKRTNKAGGRKYGAADLRSNRKHQKKRVQLNRENRRRGTYGNGDGKDLSHTASGKLVQESQSKNRARNGHNGKSRLKKARKKRSLRKRR